MCIRDRNIILFEHVGDTTVSFANTSTADDVTIIRSLDPTDISISTGGVDFDDSGDYLTIGSSSDSQVGISKTAFVKFPDSNLPKLSVNKNSLPFLAFTSSRLE